MSIEEEGNKRFDFGRQLRGELLNVNLNSIKVPIAKIHPQSESLLQSTQMRITEELGPEFKLSRDSSEVSLYIFPSQNFDLVSWILIFNMTGWILDDHLIKSPNGKVYFQNTYFLVHVRGLLDRHPQSDPTTQMQTIFG